MQVNPISVETDGPVCDLLIKMIGRPKNLIMCKASNVWGQRYRINVYTKYLVDSETGLEGKKISYSCSANLVDKELEIIHETKNYLKA